MNHNIISMADYLARREQQKQNTERSLAHDHPGRTCQEAGKTTAIIIPFPRPGPRRPAA
jgi:hypothetical protein